MHWTKLGCFSICTHGQTCQWSTRSWSISKISFGCIFENSWFVAKYIHWWKLSNILAGHSKSELDGEFTHPKSVIRREIQRLGAIGPQEGNTITGFAGANQIVQFLENHELFSPQFEKEDRQPDRKGYTMKRRYAKKADLTQSFGLLTSLILFIS